LRLENIPQQRYDVNIVLIAIDTLRADHLGCYGYARNTSPNIDAFARESVVFDRMIAPAIPTHPSFATLMTGQYSVTHGVVAQGGHTILSREAPWLPLSLQRSGYLTCAVDNLADWLPGFRRGFEFYIDPSQRRTLGLSCDNREINRRAIPWLEHNCGEKFFLFIHYWDPHTPYLPPRAYRTLFYKGDPEDPSVRAMDAMEAHPLGAAWRETWFNKLGKRITDPAYIEALYDSEIRYCDEGVGQLLKAIDRLGLRDDTIVLLISDHGEMMYRHGIFFDHHGLYDGNLHVPLIMRHPDIAPRRVAHLTAHVDMAPTLLRAAGEEIPEGVEGRDLMPLARGDDAGPIRDFVISQECTWQMKWSIRTPRHKFILAREPDFYGTPPRELYDLENDPGEFRNLAAEEPEIAARLEALLERWICDRLRRNGLGEDPLVRHGITLGKAWRDLKPPAGGADRAETA